jgi:hypothetical protein
MNTIVEKNPKRQKMRIISTKLFNLFERTNKTVSAITDSAIKSKATRRLRRSGPLTSR